MTFLHLGSQAWVPCAISKWPTKENSPLAEMGAGKSHQGKACITHTNNEL